MIWGIIGTPPFLLVTSRSLLHRGVYHASDSTRYSIPLSGDSSGHSFILCASVVL
jgi:hypothetical protein